MQGQKRQFGDHLLRSVPLAAHILRVLDERPGHAAPRGRFLAELEDHLSAEDAERTLNAVIGWGRYAGRRRRLAALVPCIQRWCPASTIQITAAGTRG